MKQKKEKEKKGAKRLKNNKFISDFTHLILTYSSNYLPSFVRFDIINKERRYYYGDSNRIFTVYGLVD